VSRSKYAPVVRIHELPIVSAQARNMSVGDGLTPVANQPKLCWHTLKSKLYTRHGLSLAIFNHDPCSPTHVSF